MFCKVARKYRKLENNSRCIKSFRENNICIGIWFFFQNNDNSEQKKLHEQAEAW